MRLHVHRSGGSLLEALEAGDHAYYATFARSRTDPALLRSIEVIAHERGHRNIVALPALSAPAERLLRGFFDLATRADSEWRYAHSSRVLLAIPDHPDIALLFLLRALKTADDAATVHALIADEWQAQIARFEINGGKPPTFAATSRRGFLRVARGLARRIMAPAPPAPCDVVLVTLGDSVANGAPDAYFGELAGTLRQRCSVTTVYVAPGKRLRFPERSDAVPLEAFLHLTDALATCAVAQTSFTGIEASPADQALIAYLRAREHTSGEVAMQRVMALAFDRMFERLKPKTVVYPFENRSWEKNLLKAARRNKVARCVGYQHSSLTPRHLAFSDCSEGSGMSPLPDAILTCGEITAERIRAEAPLLRARVTVGAALRTKRLPVNAPNRAGVLAAISSSRAEAWEMLRALHALSGRTDMPVIVRTHPTIPIEDLYRQFTWPDHVQLSRGRSLAADFQDTSLVLYSSSTVAVEGMLYGRLPIYLDIGDVPSGNPISGEHAFVFRASGADTLEEVILGIGALNDDDLEALRAQARTYAQRYLVEPTAANVDRMAELIARC